MTASSEIIQTSSRAFTEALLSVSQERVKEAVEEYFGREYELLVEFTGLISWTKGANIGWHSDDNRLYLRQRHYSAVCYLNTYEEDFKGGLFHFQEGEPSIISPSLGTLIIYTADERNMHRVDEVTEGERCTLALWFTSDRVHDEDQKLIQQISMVVPDLQGHPLDKDSETGLGMSPPEQNVHPRAAPSVMYKAYNLHNEPDQVMDGCANGELANPYFNRTSDLRVVRLGQLGLSCCFSSEVADDQHDNPVVLSYKDKEVPHLFSSSLEALQVAEFHHFRMAALNNLSSGFCEKCLVDPKWKSIMSDAHSSHSQNKVGNCVSTQTAASSLEAQLEEFIDFLNSCGQFTVYTSNLWRQVVQLFPTWRATGSLTLPNL